MGGGSAPVVGAHGAVPSVSRVTYVSRWRVQPQLSVRIVAGPSCVAGSGICGGGGRSAPVVGAHRGRSFLSAGSGERAVGGGSAPVVGAHGAVPSVSRVTYVSRWRVQPQLSVRIVAGPFCPQGRGSVPWAEVQPQLSVRMARFLPLAGLRMCRGGGFSPSCRCASWRVLPVWRVRGYAAVAGSAPVVGAHRGGSFLCARSGGRCCGRRFSPSCRYARHRSFLLLELPKWFVVQNGFLLLSERPPFFCGSQRPGRPLFRGSRRRQWPADDRGYYV